MPSAAAAAPWTVRLRAGLPLVMGIVNVTPDSFSDGGAFLEPSAALAHAQRLIAEGADLLDIGGESTRPGAAPVAEAEELRRVIPVIEALRASGVPISVDTSKAAVAERALDAGACLINDVTALRGDPRMAPVAARHRAWVVLMHMQGTPRTMQADPQYGDVAAEVGAWLAQAAADALGAGVGPDRIILDPGLGFGKTAAHNLALLRQLDRVAALGYPVLIGPSRKAFIGTVLDAPLDARLPGTLASVAWAVEHGARIVRVHDVKPAVDLIRMWQAIKNGAT